MIILDRLLADEDGGTEDDGTDNPGHSAILDEDLLMQNVLMALTRGESSLSATI